MRIPRAEVGVNRRNVIVQPEIGRQQRAQIGVRLPVRTARAVLHAAGGLADVDEVVADDAGEPAIAIAAPAERLSHRQAQLQIKRLRDFQLPHHFNQSSTDSKIPSIRSIGVKTALPPRFRRKPE